MALNPSRLGQELGAGSPEALFLQRFGGEVLAAFQEKNLFMDLTKTMTIEDGKSATFPVIGNATAKWHTAGESVITDQDADGPTDYSSAINHTEKEIFIDDSLVSPVLVPDIDRFMNHYDYRGVYVDKISHSLTKAADEHILATVLAASKDSESITGETGRPTVAVNAGFATTAATLIGGIFDAAAAFDAANVPEDQRFVALRPADYYALAQVKDLVERDSTGFGQDFGKGEILKVAGMTLVKTNNMPSTNLSAVADSGSNNDVFGASGIGYNGDWSNVVALCFQNEAVGTVKLADLAMEEDRQVDRLAHLIVASYAMGHGVLRPECAIHLSKA